jgi:hypothetical protein
MDLLPNAALALSTDAPDTDQPTPPPPRTRARTESIKRLSKRDLARGTLLYPPSIQAEHQRPRVRADCLPGGCNEQRPCPWTSCRQHLAIDINPKTGSIKLNFPDLEVWEMAETCALDVADRGGITLEQTGDIIGLTRERIRQLEQRGLAKIRAAAATGNLSDYLDEPDGAQHVSGRIRAVIR